MTNQEQRLIEMIRKAKDVERAMIIAIEIMQAAIKGESEK